MLRFLGSRRGIVVAIGAVFMFVTAFSFMPAQAAIVVGSFTNPPLVSTAQGLVDTLCRIFYYMFWFLIAISTIMGIWAAYVYVTALGEEEKITDARRILTYVAIGIVVAFLARGIPVIVGQFFGRVIGSC